MVGGPLLSTRWEKWRQVQGWPSTGAWSQILPLGLFTDDKSCPERGVDSLRSPSTWSGSSSGLTAFQGSFPRNLGIQERVKWTTEGRHLPGAAIGQVGTLPRELLEICQE